jgi:hypothetical protein
MALVTRLLKSFLGQPTPRSARHHPAPKLGMEQLEAREVPAAQLTASLSGGVLRVEGTEGADTIRLSQSAGQIAVQGVTGSFAASQVGRIEVVPLGGADHVWVGGEVTVPVEATDPSAGNVLHHGATAAVGFDSEVVRLVRTANSTVFTLKTNGEFTRTLANGSAVVLATGVRAFLAEAGGGAYALRPSGEFMYFPLTGAGQAAAATITTGSDGQVVHTYLMRRDGEVFRVDGARLVGVTGPVRGLVQGWDNGQPHAFVLHPNGRVYRVQGATLIQYRTDVAAVTQGTDAGGRPVAYALATNGEVYRMDAVASYGVTGPVRGLVQGTNADGAAQAYVVHPGDQLYRLNGQQLVLVAPTSTVTLNLATGSTFNTTGAMAAKWTELGGETGSLGRPTAVIQQANGYTLQQFQLGKLYHSVGAGVHAVLVAPLAPLALVSNPPADLTVSGVADRVRDAIQAVVPSFGNRGWTRVDELTFDLTTSEVVCGITVHAEHSWGRAPWWAGGGELAAGGEAAGAFRYNVRTGQVTQFDLTFDIPVGGWVGDTLGNMGIDNHIRFAVDEATLAVVRAVLTGDLTPLWSRAVDTLSSDDYGDVKGRYAAMAGGTANLYFASKEFVTWAGPETLAAYGGAIVASGGAATPAVLADTMARLGAEADRAVNWLAAYSAGYAQAMKQEVLRALVEGRDIDTGYFAVKWTTVGYTYGFGPASVTVHHQAFAVLWRS